MSSADAAPPLSAIAQSLLRGALHNIVHDLLVFRHRDHKLLLAARDPATTLPHCERCNLPRLLDPPLANAVRGANADPPSDAVYCDKKPWCRRPGFDIYGNPFPRADLTGRPATKKEREQAKKDGKNADGTPASNEGGTAPPSPTAQEDPSSKHTYPEKLEKGEKKASKIDEKLKKGEYVPWQTCPNSNCKRSLLIIRFAKHLEQCMGLSGRQASRNAMAKMNGSGNADTPNAGTPAGSRGGTPAPERGPGGDGEEEDEDEGMKIKGPGEVRKKVLKKGLNSRLGKSALSKPGIKDTTAATSNGKHSTQSSASTAEGNKRDISSILSDNDGEGDDSDSNVHVNPKKRQKLQRVESTTFLGSQSTAAVDMERIESQDAYNNDDREGDGSSLVGEEESLGDD